MGFLPGSLCSTKTVDNIEHVQALMHSQDDQVRHIILCMRQMHEKLVLIISKLLSDYFRKHTTFR